MPVTLANQGGVAIAVDADAVYWADLGNSKVMKVPLSGGASVILASNQAQPRGIAVNTSAVCWTNSGSDTVMRIGLSGGTPVTVASTQKYPFGIAMDADAVY
jgi:sugar lactone lactonase YvrE